MKKMNVMIAATMSLILAAACGNSTNNNNSDKKYTDTIDEQGNPIYPDTVNQDSTTVNYRDSSSNIPSGTVPPTTN